MIPHEKDRLGYGLIQVQSETQNITDIEITFTVHKLNVAKQNNMNNFLLSCNSKSKYSKWPLHSAFD